MRAVPSAMVPAACVIAAIPSRASGNDWQREIEKFELPDIDYNIQLPVAELRPTGVGIAQAFVGSISRNSLRDEALANDHAAIEVDVLVRPNGHLAERFLGQVLRRFP